MLNLIPSFIDPIEILARLSVLEKYNAFFIILIIAGTVGFVVYKNSSGKKKRKSITAGISALLAISLLWIVFNPVTLTRVDQSGSIRAYNVHSKVMDTYDFDYEYGDKCLIALTGSSVAQPGDYFFYHKDGEGEKETNHLFRVSDDGDTAIEVSYNGRKDELLNLQLSNHQTCLKPGNIQDELDNPKG